ncbi:MAG TPA: bifunctional hydroxymethylpyrimidine kinase/phosphomethylpyrimidine kinase [Polyangium sp.]|nr:bifunctional hydroxymethylpyrimidine kinase/phosphomethylpyrimidine kinase [Polyangium sp.]
MQGRVLIVAGSDSGGGAGIQADLKTVTALDAFGMTAVTALTAQNTRGVFGVFPVPTDFIKQQMAVVLDDIGADAIKTGMLHSAAVIDTVVDTLEQFAPNVPLVVDPVMVAKGGAPLLQTEAREALVKRLLPRATLLTPNLPEAEVLCGQTIRNVEDMRRAAAALLQMGPSAVLLKGGHLESPRLVDVLVTKNGEELFEDDRIESRSTHGTGCTLSSAIASHLALGETLPEAVDSAKLYLTGALEAQLDLGHGSGPMDHAWKWR